MTASSRGLTRRAKASSTPGPGSVSEAFAQLRGSGRVIDAQQGVVVAEVADTGAVELTSQPLPSVYPDLDGVGQPGLDADVHEPELGVDQVDVVVDVLALAT